MTLTPSPLRIDEEATEILRRRMTKLIRMTKELSKRTRKRKGRSLKP